MTSQPIRRVEEITLVVHAAKKHPFVERASTLPPFWLITTVAMLASTVLASSAAVAQADVGTLPDRVWLEPQRTTNVQSDWYPRSIAIRSGTVLSLDATQLVFMVQGDEEPSRIPSARVLWIEPGHRSEAETAALKSFADGKYAESISPLLDVVSQRPPVWRQQWLSMLASYASWRSSRSAVAMELVSQLDKRPLPPTTIAWLPIAWRRGAQEDHAISAGKARLQDPSAAARLVAASWLLSSPHRSAATATLKQLSVNEKRPVIARLADAALWRVASPQQVTESMSRWQKQLDAMPMALQVGPTIALIEKMRFAGHADAANRLELSLKLTPPLPHGEIKAFLEPR